MKKNGFTLIETLIAIFLLTLTVGGLLTLTANGFISVRYSRNQIVANNLLQEAVEYIRNTRDTSAAEGQSWNQWLSIFDVDQNGTAVPETTDTQGCFSSEGCTVDPYTSTVHVRECEPGQDISTSCSDQQIMFWPNASPDVGFYGYTSGVYPSSMTTVAPESTTYWRSVTIQQMNYDPDQVIVTVTVHWLNGLSKESTTQSVLIANWQNS